MNIKELVHRKHAELLSCVVKTKKNDWLGCGKVIDKLQHCMVKFFMLISPTFHSFTTQNASRTEKWKNVNLNTETGNYSKVRKEKQCFKGM